MLKPETKVKLASLATYIASTAGLALLGIYATDYSDSLPDWLEAVLYPLVPALAALLTGYQAKNKPADLSDSTLDAARSRLGMSRPTD